MKRHYGHEVSIHALHPDPADPAAFLGTPPLGPGDHLEMPDPVAERITTVDAQADSQTSTPGRR